MKISIIIATWNAALTIKRCLDSIIPQLSDEVELIIVDGKSQDSTNTIIASYKQYISNHISECDNGIYDAWNKGIKLAKGEWIMFVGADDILLPNALMRYLNFIEETKDINSFDYICAQNEYTDKNGRILKIIGEKFDWKVFRKRMDVAHVASLHNKQNLFESIGYFNYKQFKICADYELLMRKKEKLKALFIYGHIARMQVGGMSFSTKAIIETYKIRKLHHSVPSIQNKILLFRDWIAFKIFIIRKGLLNIK